MDQELTLLPECPFLLKKRERTIICEGIRDQSILELKFRRSAHLKQHWEDYCCSMDYEHCPIGKMLFAKYDREGEDRYG